MNLIVGNFVLATLIAILIVHSGAMVYQEELNLQELELLFGDEECVEGALIVSDIDGANDQTVLFKEHVNENELVENVEEKSPMSSLHELAFLNKIDYQYILTNEEGAPHKKRFNVSLYLGDEVYSSEDSSIKKAQNTAARLALLSTKYDHPPKKINKSRSMESKKRHYNPIQQLEDWVSKHWDASISYSLQEPSSKQHSNFYHADMYSKPSIFKATVKIKKLEFIGEGLTLEIAKQKAASNALQGLINLSGFCLLEEKLSLWSRFFQSDDKSDSPISFIYEFASRTKQKVTLDLISEEGPSHQKEFTFNCRIGDQFQSFGKGKDKKNAKKEAASNMIKKLQVYAYNNNINCGGTYKKKSKKPNKKKLLKSISKNNQEIVYEHTFPDDIDPISKLMQIQQVSHDVHPVFTLLEEKGETIKQFFMEVKVGDNKYVGAGPNKKTAKRKAAEGMLEILGYSRPSKGIKVSMHEQKKKEFTNTAEKIPLASGIHLSSQSFSKIDHNQDSSSFKSNPSIKDKKNIGSKVRSNENLDKSKKEVDIVLDIKAPKTHLDNISKKLGIRYQFSDFPKRNDSGMLSLLSLTTDPPKVCYGTGTTTDLSQEMAAQSALKDLYKSHLITISEILRDPMIDLDSEEWSNFADLFVPAENHVTEL